MASDVVEIIVTLEKGTCQDHGDRLCRSFFCHVGVIDAKMVLGGYEHHAARKQVGFEWMQVIYALAGAMQDNSAVTVLTALKDLGKK